MGKGDGGRKEKKKKPGILADTSFSVHQVSIVQVPKLAHCCDPGLPCAFRKQRVED